MNRRNFIKKLTAATAGLLILPKLNLFAMGEQPVESDEIPIRRTASGYDATALHIADPDAKALSIRFLGTGAGGKVVPDKNGDIRRHSSILIERSIVIDMTESSLDMVPEDVHPEVLIYTHSHHDHYDPAAAMRLGVKYVFLGKEWAEAAKKDFKKAYKKLQAEGVEATIPTLFPLGLDETIEFVEEDGSQLSIKALLGNHVTSRLEELAHIYLIVKESPSGATNRLLYATDTSGITGRAARGAGIDAHVKDGLPINGLIMEATMGNEFEEDFRFFNHSSTELVARTVRVLQDTERLVPKDKNPVYITHLSKKLHPVQREVNKSLPKPLRAAHDGLEVKYLL